MAANEPQDPERVLANLRAHLDQHRDLAQERETRIIELEQRVRDLEADAERRHARARDRERALERELESARRRRERVEAQLLRLRTRRPVRAALWLAEAARPIIRLRSRVAAARHSRGGAHIARGGGR